MPCRIVKRYRLIKLINFMYNIVGRYMRILIYSDNHFCTSSSIINGVGEKYSVRLENQIDSLNWVEELGKKEKCDIEICLGDFFDKETLTSQELSALKEIKWDMNDIERFFIVGNHEMGSQDLTYNSTNALSEYGYICNRPMLIPNSNCNIVLIPYVLESNRKPLREYINEAFDKDGGDNLNRNLPVIILTHNDIKGIQYGGFESKVGFSLEEINDNCIMLLDGHLHNETSFDIPHHQENTKVYLVGNLTGQNFSEDAFNHGHYAYILDTDSWQLGLQRFENPYAFKFYKLDIDESNIEQLKDFELNSVVSIKTKQSIVDRVRETVYNNKNIIKSRIMIIPEITEGINNQEIISKDHITQYKEFTYPKLREELSVSDEIIKEELRRL